MNALERRATGGLATVYAIRMLGLFMILPVFALYARDLPGATSVKIGLALGIYGLTQALLQIPFGVASDRIGRKPMIVLGLILFAGGSMLAAVSRDIDWIIVGRALQGGGAIAAVANALLADLTRPVERTKAMLILGIGIGLSFTLALVLGPALETWIGVPGIFALTAALGIAAIPVVWWVVPDPQGHVAPAHSGIVGEVRTVMADTQLLRLDAGVFILHACLTALFIALPLSLTERAGLAADRHWQLYLPVLVGSLALTLPLIHLAERRGQLKMVFLAAIGLLAICCSAFVWAQETLARSAAVLFLFFGAFNLLEASLPSLVSRLCPAALRGAGMGVYSTSQFLGAFAGGAVGGLAQQALGNTGLYALAAVGCALWLVIATGLRPPVASGATAGAD